MGKTKKINIILFLILIFGSLFSSLTMIKSGLKYDFGLGFWGPNGHDAIWHISLINQLKKQIPPQNPIFSDTLLINYHWGFDLFAAKLSQFLNLNTLDLYFRILPVLFSISIGILSFYLAFLITKNKITSLLFVFFNFFNGSFGWIITLIQNQEIAGESLFWSMQSISFLLNPPYAFSLIILLAGIILWVKHYNSKSVLWPLFIGFIFGLLSLIKVYSAILIGLSLSTFYILTLYKNKKIFNFNFFICLSTAFFSILILYLIGVLKSSAGLLEFKPFWFSHSLIESIDKLYFPKLASYRYNLAQNITLVKTPLFIFIELFLFLVFVLGNLGTRIFGLIYLFKQHLKKQLHNFDLLISVFLFFSLLFPTIFVQKGTPWNTIQFLYYFLFFANYYLAKFIADLFQNNKYKLLSFCLIFISILTTFGTLKDYFGFPPPASLPNDELQALNFLKNQEYGYVLTYPYDKYKKNNQNTPIPLYMYETTSYVSAFSEKPTFLEDEMNLDITGFDWQKRRKESETFFNSQDKFFARGFLLNNKIDYIYLTDNQELRLNETDLQIDLIFKNSQSQVYKIRK